MGSRKNGHQRFKEKVKIANKRINKDLRFFVMEYFRELEQSGSIDAEYAFSIFKRHNEKYVIWSENEDETRKAYRYVHLNHNAFKTTVLNVINNQIQIKNGAKSNSVVDRFRMHFNRLRVRNTRNKILKGSPSGFKGLN